MGPARNVRRVRISVTVNPSASMRSTGGARHTTSYWRARELRRKLRCVAWRHACADRETAHPLYAFVTRELFAAELYYRLNVLLLSDDLEVGPYEVACMAIGVRVIRVFRQRADAEQWLTILSTAGRFHV